MPIAKSSSSNVAPVPAGTHLGICYSVIDIGTPPQHGNFPSRRKVLISFELPHVRASFTNKETGATEERARVISGDFTLSTDKKATLRKHLAAWRGRDFTADEAKAFDIGKVCGVPALLSVVHKPSADGSKVFANIASIMAPMKGVVAPPLENAKLIWDIPAAAPVAFPDDMPEWIQNRIKASDEYIALTNPQASAPRDEGHGGTGQAFPTDGPDLDCPF